MSISDITPSDCPPGLKARIEKVMAAEGLSWKGAVFFSRTEGGITRCPSNRLTRLPVDEATIFYYQRVVSPRRRI